MPPDADPTIAAASGDLSPTAPGATTAAGGGDQAPAGDVVTVGGTLTPDATGPIPEIAENSYDTGADSYPRVTLSTTINGLHFLQYFADAGEYPNDASGIWTSSTDGANPNDPAQATSWNALEGTGTPTFSKAPGAQPWIVTAEGAGDVGADAAATTAAATGDASPTAPGATTAAGNGDQSPTAPGATIA